MPAETSRNSRAAQEHANFVVIRNAGQFPKPFQFMDAIAASCIRKGIDTPALSQGQNATGAPTSFAANPTLA